MWEILGNSDRGRARGARTQRAGLRWRSSPKLEDKEFLIPKNEGWKGMNITLTGQLLRGKCRSSEVSLGS